MNNGHNRLTRYWYCLSIFDNVFDSLRTEYGIFTVSKTGGLGKLNHYLNISLAEQSRLILSLNFQQNTKQVTILRGDSLHGGLCPRVEKF